MSLAITLHILSAVIWVGGMFFAWMCLRPVAAGCLEPPHRLRLWTGVFRKFFPWVWVAVILLPATGYWIIAQIPGGLDNARWHIHVMQALGIAMILIYLHVFFAPFKRLKKAVADENWPAGGEQLAQIRKLVGFNLVLGLIVAAIGAGGRYIII